MEGLALGADVGAGGQSASHPAGHTASAAACASETPKSYTRASRTAPHQVYELDVTRAMCQLYVKLGSGSLPPAAVPAGAPLNQALRAPSEATENATWHTRGTRRAPGQR